MAVQAGSHPCQKGFVSTAKPHDCTEISISEVSVLKQLVKMFPVAALAMWSTMRPNLPSAVQFAKIETMKI